MTSQSLPIAASAKLSTSPSEADLSRLTDEELILCLRAGSSEAMTHLFDRYYVAVRGIARRVLRNSEDIADVIQESFLDLHQNARTFDSAKESRDEEEALSILEANVKPEQWIRSLDFRNCLEKTLASLNEKQRKTMEMYFFEGKELTVIAKETGESFGNARHHLYRGLEKIRKELVQNRLLAGYIEFGDLEEKSSRR
ncbi:MAG: hypothetical protein DMG40_01085 [Acidobacteria bacterium]|nr:MAG: hypothetical protein DMG40_01085 [Acidobacteriota bacterium]